MRLPRFYPILDTGILHSRGIDPSAAASALLDAGAEILQFRHKLDWTQATYTQARSVSDLCRDAGATFIVNDRADIALLLDAGLHVGQEDLPASQARAIIGPDRILGLSTHNETQLRAAADQPVDYIAFGPIFATISKQNPDPVVGVAELARLRTLTERPLVAIGGITRETAPDVWSAGADSVAIIGDLTRPVEEWTQLAHEYSPR